MTNHRCDADPVVPQRLSGGTVDGGAVLRSLAKRCLLFCSGMLVLALGIVLVIGFFQIDAVIPKLGGYVFLVPLFGLALVWAAFSKSTVAGGSAAADDPAAAGAMEPPPLPAQRRGTVDAPDSRSRD